MADIIVINSMPGMECSHFLLANPVLLPVKISLPDSGDPGITTHPSISGSVNETHSQSQENPVNSSSGPPSAGNNSDNVETTLEPSSVVTHNL